VLLVRDHASRIDPLSCRQSGRHQELCIGERMLERELGRVRFELNDAGARRQLLNGARFSSHAAGDEYHYRESGLQAVTDKTCLHALFPPILLVTTVLGFTGTGTNSLMSFPVSGSLSRTTPSNPAEATCVPSGRNAIE